MDPPLLLPFDSWDNFDDILTVSSSSPDFIRTIQNWDNLIPSFFYDEDLMENPLVNSSSVNMRSTMSTPTISLAAPSRRQSKSFHRDLIDNKVGGMMTVDSNKPMNGQNEIFMDDYEMWNYINSIPLDNIPFPYEEQFQEPNLSARSPMDGVFDPFNADHTIGIEYQPIAPPLVPSLAYDFGFTEFVPYMSEIQATSMYEYDLAVIKKQVKKRQNVPSATPSSELLNMNEWHLRDQNGRRRRPLLYEFLLLLLNNKKYSDIINYVDKRHGIFKFYQREKAAELWGLVKGRNGSSKMTYDKLARGIRFYYGSEIIRPTPGRFTFRFGSASGYSST